MRFPGTYNLNFYEQVLRDPTTAALAVAATAASAAGSIEQGNAADKSYKSQAAADNYNAAIEQLNKQSVEQSGTSKEILQDRQNAMTMGEARASAGQANIGGLQGGTISNVLEQDSVNGELNSLGIAYQRDTAAAADQDAAQMDTYEAGVSNVNAANAKRSGQIGALTSILKGGNSYFQGQQALNNAQPPSANFANNSLQQVGPFDNSLPWRNQPTQASF